MKKKKPSKTKKKTTVSKPIVTKDDKLLPTIKFKTLTFREVKKFMAGQRYLIHLKNGVLKLSTYIDLEYLKSVNPMLQNVSPEEIKNLPQSYFLVDQAAITYCLLEDLQGVYSVSDGKIYHSSNHPNG